MTDIIDIKALREASEIGESSDYMTWPKVDPAKLKRVLAQLEAECQRADAVCRDIRIQANDLKSAQTVNKVLQAELAALKGDQVPFAFSYNYAGCETSEGFQDWRKELSRERPPEWMLETGKVTALVELFTTQQKPVVLPVVPHDFVLHTGGKQIHFGVNARTGESLWHSCYDGSDIWCGSWYARTLQELESECISTLAAIKAAIVDAGGKVAE